jgi:hypothetical protein
MFELIKNGVRATNNFLSKLFAAVVGATLFSLTSLVLNLLVTLAFLTLSLTFDAIIPVAVAYFSYKHTNSIYASSVFALVAFNLSYFIIPLALLASTVTLALKIIWDLGHTVFYGLKEGYTKGVTSIVSKWWNTRYNFLDYAREESSDNSLKQLQVLVYNFFGWSSASQREAMRMEQQTSRVEDDSYQYPDLEQALQESFNTQPSFQARSLSEKDYAQLEGEPISGNFDPLTAKEIDLASKDTASQSILERYKTLDEQLDALKPKSEPGEPTTTPYDQLIPYMEIEKPKPILLVKQVFDPSSKTWLVAHGCTWTTDKDSLWQWAKVKATHPTNRDSLTDTSTTRYRYHDYEGKGSSLELREIAQRIRLKNSLQKMDKPQGDEGSANRSFSVYTLLNRCHLTLFSSKVEKNPMEMSPSDRLQDDGSTKNHFPSARR